MAQLSSNTLVYNQIFYKIREFLVADMENRYRTNEERATAYNEILQEIYESVAQPLTKLDPIIKGEPPISEKINRYASSFADDLNIVAKQVDFLNAKAVSIFNMFFTETEREKKFVERVASKAKILQMYARSPSNDLVYYGDSFENMDKIDPSRIRSGLIPLVSSGECTLPVLTIKPYRPKRIILNKEDGFLGNNHQVIRALNSEGTSSYRYVFEDVPNISLIASVGDSNPLTFVEVEALNVDKESSTADTALLTDGEFSFILANADNTSASTNTLVNWSNYDVSKPLKASFIMEFQSSLANSLDIMPYFGSCDLVKVEKIKITKKDGVTVDLITDPIWIGSSLLPLNLEISKNYFYNQATIRFPETEVLQAEVLLSQDRYQNIEIGHYYWKPNYGNSSPSDNPFVGMSRFSPDALSREIYSEIDYDRFALIPKSNRPNEMKRNGSTTKNVKVRLKTAPQKYEVWVIAFNANKTEDNPDAGKKKSYFNGWVTSIETPNDGVNFSGSISFQDGNLVGAKYFSSEVQAQADLDAFIAYIAAQPSSTLTKNGISYAITDIVLEKVERTNAGYETTYDVPIISKREIYRAKRLAIGIRDISLKLETYALRAEIVSKSFQFDRNVEALMLSVESSVDRNFANDISMNYYISVDGEKWIAISPVQLDSRGIAEVLVFNKNLSSAEKLPGVAYLNSPDVPIKVNEASVKIEFSRSRAANVTPSIYSYELIAKVEN